MWEGKNSSDAGHGMEVWRYLLLVDTTAKYVYIWDRDDNDDEEDQYGGGDNNFNQKNHIKSKWVEKNNCDVRPAAWRCGVIYCCLTLLLSMYIYLGV